MTARVVYDGCTVKIPPEMGEPRVDQMQGTELEKLVELAGRKCYDSLGTGRPSSSFHQHIKDAGHTSIWEHAVVAMQFAEEDVDWYELVNRKGVHVYPAPSGDKERVVIAANLRAISEWETKGLGWVHRPRPRATVGDRLRQRAHARCPQIISPPEYDGPLLEACCCLSCVRDDLNRPITLYLSGSRAWSHEMITHRYAKSQRSDRFCDASETEWVWHPDFDGIDDEPEPSPETGLINDNVGLWQEQLEDLCKQAYSLASSKIETKLLDRGVDRTSARKRARSAARGFLGHALRTDMIFTATAAEWLDIIRQRMSPAADPEIAGVIEEARDVLRTSQSGHLFA